MNLITRIKNIFKKNRVTSTSLSSISDLISLPTRVQLSDHPEYLTSIENYKKEYSRILASKRSIVSSELTPDNLRNDMNMYIELILNLIESKANPISFEPTEEKEGQEKLDLTCKMTKLKAYFYNIKSLEIETTLRLVALTEILHEKIFLSPIKKNALREEINNLSSALLTFLNQRTAIAAEIEAYLKEYSLLNNEEFTITNDSEKKLVNRRIQSLLEMLKNLEQPTEYFTNKNADLNPIVTIALMEEILERFIYHHKNQVEQLKIELTEITTEYQTCKKDSKEILFLIERLERKYIAFTEYGRNLITKDDLSLLYKTKFDILTLNVYGTPDLQIGKQANRFELECYMDILFTKITDLISGITLPNNFKKALPTISKILKNGSGEYNLYEILNNQKLLSFLLAFESVKVREKLKSFYDRWTINLHDISHIDLHKDFFTWQESLSLSTFYTIMFISDTTIEEYLKNPSTKSADDYINMVSQKSIYEDDNYYQFFKYLLAQNYIIPEFPDSLTKITFPKENFQTAQEKAFISNFRKTFEHANIIFPVTLEELNGALFNNISVYQVQLNEGLKKMNGKNFNDSKITELYIPSSLQEIGKEVFRNTRVGTIYINNFSRTELSDLSLDNLITSFFYARKTDKTRWHYISDYVRQKQREYREGRYSTFCDKDLFEYDAQYTTYEIVPAFQDLVFLEDGVEVVRIKADDIKITRERDETIQYSRYREKPAGTICELSGFESIDIKEYLTKELQQRLPEDKKHILSKSKSQKNF